MKRVPEERKKGVPERDKQLQWLLEKLAGHMAFVHLRGAFDPSVNPMDHLTRLISGAGSPTAFCGAWDRYASDVRVVGDILAQFRRDGWNDAADELEHALEWPGYTLPGETVPLDATTPVTALIIDFPRTHAMLTWIRAGHWMELNSFLDGEKVSLLAKRLFEQFPSLRKHTELRRRQGGYEGWDLLTAYRDDAHAPVMRLFGNEWMKSFVEESRQLHIGFQTYNDHLEVGSGVFGYLFVGDQASVLSRISREDQHRVATWSFRAPKIIVDTLITEKGSWNSKYEWERRFAIGFHPESRHGDWSRAGGAYPSLGCAHGYGAVLLDRRKYEYGDHLIKYNDMTGGGYAVPHSEDEEIAFLLQPR